MLNMVLASKAHDKLLDITAIRGKVNDVNSLQKALKKQAAMSDKKGKTAKPDWDDTISQLASKFGDKETARRAKLLSKAEKIVMKSKEDNSNGSG